MNTPTQSQPRSVLDLWPAHSVIDGDGVRINRNSFSGRMHLLDPFLMLDEIVSEDPNDYIGGFPEHPHRGFETVTYMLEGKMLHRDHMGNTGELVGGSVQWMTAGRGVLHSEMPQQESGRLHGFQLWVNLPAKYKMCVPNYREYQPADIESVDVNRNSQIKVIAGSLQYWQADQWSTAVEGPVQGITTAPIMYDIHLSKGEDVNLKLDGDKKVLLYSYQGAVDVVSAEAQKTIPEKHMALLDSGDHVHLSAHENSRLLLLAGTPLREPIIHWGPFVMNSSDEIEQAVRDYHNGTLV